MTIATQNLRLLNQRPALSPASFGAGAAPAAAPTNSAWGGDTYSWSTSVSGAPASLGPALQGSALRQAIGGVFAQGVARDWAGANQQRALDRLTASLSEGQLVSLRDLLDQAGGLAEQVFILKAVVVGEPWQNVVAYAGEMRGMPEAEVVRRSTMRDDADVIQQWQDACGPATIQAIAGEADPRFAWELNKAGDLARIDPAGAAKLVADQQKEWLERYGGMAVERGRSGGDGMALGQILNDRISALTGATYQTVEATDLTQALDRTEALLKDGYDVPLRIEWSPPGAGPGYGHFILAMNVRGARGARELQIHDPWTGKTDWIREGDMARNSFAPIFSDYARLTHTYEAQTA